MQSSICNFFIKAAKKISVFFDNSILGKFFYAVCSFVMRVISNSIIGKIIKKKPHGEITDKESLFGKLLLLPFKFISFIFKKTSEKYSSIRSGSKLLYIADNWNLVSIRLYGATFCSFGLLYGILRFFTGALTTKALFISLFFFVLGLAAFLINRSLKSLFKGSVLLKTIGGFFYDNAANEHSKLFLEDDAIHTTGTIASFITGAVFAVIAFFLTPLDFLLAIIIPLFLLLVIKHPQIIIFITALASPILPTLVLAACSILCAASLALKLMRSKSIKLLYSPLYIPAALFALSYFLGAITSFTFISSMQIFFIHVAFIVFYFVLYNALGNDKTYKAIISAFVLMGGLVAFYGVLQNFIGVSTTSSWVDSSMFTDIKLRVYSTFDNPNVLGEYLVVMIPLAMALFLRSEKKVQKLVYLAVLAVCALCLIFTWSRGAWLGACIAVMVYLVATDKRWALCALIIVVALPFIPLILSSDSAVVSRITSIGNMSDGSTAYRVSIWQSALQIIHDFWLGGIGPGSDAFSSIYQKYALPGVSFALHSHNLFLQLAVELGISGIVLFIALLLKNYKNSARSLLYSENKKSLRTSVTIACTAGLSGLLFQGLTDYVWYNYKILLIFWIILAFSTSRQSKKPKGGNA